MVHVLWESNAPHALQVTFHRDVLHPESFNRRVRDELLNIEEFGSLLEALVVVEAWRVEYNTYRPHSSLGGLVPSEDVWPGVML